MRHRVGLGRTASGDRYSHRLCCTASLYCLLLVQRAPPISAFREPEHGPLCYDFAVSTNTLSCSKSSNRLSYPQERRSVRSSWGQCCSASVPVAGPASRQRGGKLDGGRMASANGLAGFESVLEVQKDVKATLEGADGGLEEPA